MAKPETKAQRKARLKEIKQTENVRDALKGVHDALNVRYERQPPRPSRIAGYGKGTTKLSRWDRKG
jgi:hypothetical protein